MKSITIAPTELMPTITFNSNNDSDLHSSFYDYSLSDSLSFQLLHSKILVVVSFMSDICINGLFFTCSSSKLINLDIISSGIVLKLLSFKFNTFKFIIFANDGGSDSSLLLLKSIVSIVLLLIFSNTLSIRQMQGCVTFSQNKFLHIRSSLDDSTRALTSY